MPPSTLLQRLKLRHKIAALGVVGMALCTLPLIQLLRYQGLELQWAREAQDQLEPALLAVDLQRGLVDHRASAARWLQGQRQVEALRRQHQAVVDARLAMLDHRLAQTTHVPAQAEVAAMRTDWLALVQRVISAQCRVVESDLAHRLLVEQTLQIIDTVTVAALGSAGPAAAARQPELALLQQSLAAARIQLAAGQPGWPGAMARLDAAQAQVQQAQSRRRALHQASRSQAAAGLLALAVGIVGLLAWLHTVRQRLRPGLRAAGGQAAAPGHASWQPAAADGQQAERSARYGLLQRLRRPAPEAPRLDQPTQPQEP